MAVSVVEQYESYAEDPTTGGRITIYRIKATVDEKYEEIHSESTREEIFNLAGYVNY